MVYNTAESTFVNRLYIDFASFRFKIETAKLHLFCQSLYQSELNQHIQSFTISDFQTNTKILEMPPMINLIK